MRPHLRLDTGRDVSHQFPHDVLLAIESRHMEGRHAELPAEVPQGDVLLHELADDGAVAEPGGQVDRRHPGLVLVQRGGSTAQQQLDHVSVTALSRHVERGGVGDPVPVGRHDALVELEQLLQHADTALLGGNVGGGVTILDNKLPFKYSFSLSSSSVVLTFVVAVTREGCFCRNNLTTSG